jgi:hypothetical protein
LLLVSARDARSGNYLATPDGGAMLQDHDEDIND